MPRRAAEAGVRRGFTRRRRAHAGADPRAAGEVEGHEGGGGCANRRGAGTKSEPRGRRSSPRRRNSGRLDWASTTTTTTMVTTTWARSAAPGEPERSSRAARSPPAARGERRSSRSTFGDRRSTIRSRSTSAVRPSRGRPPSPPSRGGRGGRARSRRCRRCRGCGQLQSPLQPRFRRRQTPKSGTSENLRRKEGAPTLRPRLGFGRGIEEGRATGALDRVAGEGTEREDSRLQSHHVLARHHGRGPQGCGRHGHQGHQGAQARGAPGRRRRPRQRRVTGRRRQGRR